MLNQEKDFVQPLDLTRPYGIPTVDPETQVVLAPDQNGTGFAYFDPRLEWAPSQRLIILPSGLSASAMNYKHSFAAHKTNGYIYTACENGNIFRFHPATRIAEFITALEPYQSRICFDPFDPDILYMSYRQTHCIYTYNIETGEYTLFAGTKTAGFRNGHRLEAEFNFPHQMVIDSDGSLVVADRYNHCIRRISRDGMVSTVIGKGGIRGYQDGNPEDALFYEPCGMAIDKHGNLYVADALNSVIRKLAVQ